MLNKKFILFFTLVGVLIFCSTATAAANNTTVSMEKPTQTKTITTVPSTYTAENPNIDGYICVYQKVSYNSTRGVISSNIYWKDINFPEDMGPVSTYSSIQINPKIAGSLVIWEDYREGTDKPVIYWKNISNGTGGRVSSYTGPHLSQINPAISGTRVVWTDHREGAWVIYWKDIVSSTGGRVSDYTGVNLDQKNPAISGSRVVWEDYREGATTPVIYWKNLTNSAGGRVSSYTGPNLKQMHPEISGTRVVWMDWRESGKFGKIFPIIYWKDLNNALQGGRVSSYSAPVYQGPPAISGSRVVWGDDREIPLVIYWKDLVTNAGGRVSTYTGDNLWQDSPAISGTRVVWQDGRAGNNNGFLWSVYFSDVISGVERKVAL